MASIESRLWAITCFFNPAGYQQRRKNFRIFRQLLGVPLVTVELAHGDKFELAAADSDVLVQLRSSSVLWQKECLLNIALSRVPPRVPVIAWLDCDIIFERTDWVTPALDALEKKTLVQLFSERHDLPAGVTRPGPNSHLSNEFARSIAHLAESGAWRVEGSDTAEPARIRQAAFGLGWAARRNLLERHAFYDAMVMGSGDRALACAGYGRFGDAIAHLRLDTLRASHYLAWAQPFYADVQGNIGGISGRLFHLWHGERKHRAYKERHARFADMHFDPAADICRNADGVLQWVTERPELDAFGRAYFAARREDDVPAD